MHDAIIFVDRAISKDIQLFRCFVTIRAIIPIQSMIIDLITNLPFIVTRNSLSFKPMSRSTLKVGIFVHCAIYHPVQITS